MRGWCPKCQKITQHLIEETEVVKIGTCLKCHTLLISRVWKVAKEAQNDSKKFNRMDKYDTKPH